MRFELLTVVGEEFQGHSYCVDEFAQRELIKWIPTAKDISCVDSGAFFYLPLNRDTGALCYCNVVPSRTIGIREHVVTRVLPFPRKCTQRFFDNAALFAYHIISSGVFTETESDLEHSVADRSLFEPLRWAAEFERSELQDAANAVQIHERSIVFSTANPLKLLAATIALLAPKSRWSTHFAYGLALSDSRPFNLQLFGDRDSVTANLLFKQNIRNFDIASPEKLIAH